MSSKSHMSYFQMSSMLSSLWSISWVPPSWMSSSVLPKILCGSKEVKKWKWSRSVVSDSLRPHRVTQSSPTLHPMDCSLPGSSIGGILQARVLEWVAVSFSRRSSQPRDRTQVSCIAGRTPWILHLSNNIIIIFFCESFPYQNANNLNMACLFFISGTGHTSWHKTGTEWKCLEWKN